MRLAIIACRVFAREIAYYAACSPNTCIVYWLEQGLHNTPTLLQKTLQQQVDEIEKLQEGFLPYRKFDAIVLGYGLCSNGVVGVKTRTLPMIVPKTDDCIALFLGSQKRYLKEFASHNGVYWFNPGWIEFGNVPVKRYYDELYTRYCEEYGEDNADYLMEAENTWSKSYENCIYITTPLVDNAPYEAVTRGAADYLHCEYVALQGDNAMLQRLLAGEWDEESFLTCPPGYALEASYGADKITYSPQMGE